MKSLQEQTKSRRPLLSPKKLGSVLKASQTHHWNLSKLGHEEAKLPQTKLKFEGIQ